MARLIWGPDMTTINNLTDGGAVASGTLFAGWSTPNGDTRRFSADALAAYINPTAGNAAQVYSAPSATGFTVALSGEASIWLILTPTAGFAAGTITLPTAPVNMQTITVNCTQPVASLTISGGTITGAPTSLSANGFFTLQYDAVLSTWYRVG